MSGGAAPVGGWGRQLLILRHAIGLNDDGKAGKHGEYRNHFVTGKGSNDYADCMALVASGHMIRRAGSELTGGDDLFMVTDAGRSAARAAVLDHFHGRTES